MLPDGSRLAVVEAFAHVLGNTCCLQRMAQSCAWNVQGPYSAEASALFRRQANEMFGAQGLIAGRIRTMGEIAVPDESDLVLSASEAVACRRAAEIRSLVGFLTGGHRKMIGSIRAASDVAFDIDDRASLLLLDMRLLAHERHLAQLATFAH